MKCHIYADNIHVTPSTLHNLVSPWPFSMWGLDMIGPIEAKASNGHRFILVAIDYFTKWVKVASYASMTRSIVVRFIKRDIICWYSLPTHIITDNGTNLNNKMMIELCEQFKIKHHNSTPYRPKMNGAIEAANKNIKKIVQKMVMMFKDWHDMLPYALQKYHMSIRISMVATPYSLVYGTKVVLPMEVEIPSLRVLAEVELSNIEWADKILYRKRIKRAFDKRVRPRIFKEGDLRPANWAPNNQGPYMVKHTFSEGALMLADSKGQGLKSNQHQCDQAILPMKALLGKNLKS
ncbi:pol, partial [Mucuna pruriens]